MGDKAVIFDADNTLWKLQALYDAARASFLDYMDDLTDAGRAAVRTEQQRVSALLVHEIDPATGQKYLYTAARFPASFEAALLSFHSRATDAEKAHVRLLGNSVFDRKAAPMEGVGALLRDLKQAGYKLIILTKGERWVQEKRLAEFDHTGLFDDVCIVDDKNEAVFRALIDAHDIDIDRSFSVGDSVKADIIPADSVGLNTILLRSHTWAPEAEGPVPPRAATVHHLHEVLGVISEKEKNMEQGKTDNQLKQRLRSAWSAVTSSDPARWSPDNPAWGQCAVTCCAVQDQLGGEIVWAEAVLPGGEKVSHYFNKINGQEVDFTREQFPDGTVIPEGVPKTKEFATTRDYILSFEKTRERYLQLKKEMA